MLRCSSLFYFLFISIFKYFQSMIFIKKCSIHIFNRVMTIVVKKIHNLYDNPHNEQDRKCSLLVENLINLQ